MRSYYLLWVIIIALTIGVRQSPAQDEQSTTQSPAKNDPATTIIGRWSCWCQNTDLRWIMTYATDGTVQTSQGKRGNWRVGGGKIITTWPDAVDAVTVLSQFAIRWTNAQGQNYAGMRIAALPPTTANDNDSASPILGESTPKRTVSNPSVDGFTQALHPQLEPVLQQYIAAIVKLKEAFQREAQLTPPAQA